MNLEFTPLKKINTNVGERWFQTAIPTADFWREWRFNKDAMGNAGIGVRYTDGRPEVFRVLTYNRDQEPEPAPVAPYMVKNRSHLLPYQPDAVQALCSSLVSNRIAIDASDAGIGKTYHALAVCRELGLTPGIVCTKTGIIAWRRVCDLFNIRPLFIINWEGVISRKLKTGDRSFRIVGSFPYCVAKQNRYTGRLSYDWNLPRKQNYCIIFDECHKGNGRGTSQSAIMSAAYPYPLVCLSATLADRAESLRTIGVLCRLFKPEDFTIWLQKQGCYKNNYEQWQSVSPVDDMRRIGKVLFPRFGTRVRKADIPGFPAIQNIADVYPIKDAVKHNKAYQHFMGELEALERQRLSAAAQKQLEHDAQRIANLNKLMRDAQAEKLVANLRYRQYTELLKVDLFADLVREQIENDQSVVVFVNFTDTLLALAKKLKTENIIWGEQSGSRKGMDERKNIIDDFMADKIRLVLANICAGGVSISLHDTGGRYPRVALISPTYSAITLVQALGRIHRSGAKSASINRLVYAADTVEELVCRSVSVKLDTIAALNDADLAETDIFNLMKRGK